LATLRYQNGYSDYLTVVDAERNLYTAQLQYVQDQGTLYTAMVSLYAALGGGWVVLSGFRQAITSTGYDCACRPFPGG
jgi:multidrug efflux system outer membrane protein